MYIILFYLLQINRPNLGMHADSRIEQDKALLWCEQYDLHNQ